MAGSTPYLSVVAASRNDDHGGALLQRMQLFVEGLADQAVRHALPIELVLVEWNPPAGRARLADALRWPDDQGFCEVRIVTVPTEQHERLGASGAFHQMPAKNVGIRRARGEFVLSTNVDLLWSDPLARFLSRRALEARHVYRADRIDVTADVPLDGSPEARLAHCAQHVLRASRPADLCFVPDDGLAHRVEDATIPSAQRFARDAASPGASQRTRFERRLRGTALGRALETPPRQLALRAPWQIARGAAFAARHAALVLGGWRSGGHLRDFDQLADEALRPFRRFPALHLLNCGDFMLMARSDWDAIGGHPELACFSLHLDSLTLHIAASRGIREQRLASDEVVYHLEHDSLGSANGNTEAFYGALRGRGVSVMGWGRLARHAHQLANGRALRFSPDDWGLATRALAETHIVRGKPIEAAPLRSGLER